MIPERISSTCPYTSHYADIYGSKMHYLEEGVGDPILFLHGIPTSSYLWRNIIPYIMPLGRCIAPDLIGMGKSAKPNIEYTIADHIRYIEKFIETLNLNNLILVLHGWGSVIGLDYAMRHEKNCRGIAFYEAFLRPFHQEDISLPLYEQVISLQEQTTAPDLTQHGVNFVDQIITQGVMRKLSEAEKNQYREPFSKPGTGKPLQQYLKEFPHGDGKSKADQLITQYSKKLSHSKLPKLMLYSVPGFITTIGTAMWARDTLPNLELVDIGEELHFAQESHPKLIGETVSIWLQGIETGTA
ncbi:MAG: hypothetical protein A3E84_01585 [Gammaproteobacteria bacterium RIFCSPHIGHO2_12_FULL_42_13]|nr:MAG: hypothetical protein A3E84_01585 [Gammaproteobacteria bacterium RIFCSPHIGHO2_12_FULL_42_13]